MSKVSAEIALPDAFMPIKPPLLPPHSLAVARARAFLAGTLTEEPLLHVAPSMPVGARVVHASHAPLHLEDLPARAHHNVVYLRFEMASGRPSSVLALPTQSVANLRQTLERIRALNEDLANMRPVTLKLRHHPGINAVVENTPSAPTIQVTLTTGALAQLGQATLAGLLAHEIGHALAPAHTERRQREWDADSVAVRLVGPEVASRLQRYLTHHPERYESHARAVKALEPTRHLMSETEYRVALDERIHHRSHPADLARIARNFGVSVAELVSQDGADAVLPDSAAPADATRVARMPAMDLPPGFRPPVPLPATLGRRRVTAKG